MVEIGEVKSFVLQSYFVCRNSPPPEVVRYLSGNFCINSITESGIPWSFLFSLLIFRATALLLEILDTSSEETCSTFLLSSSFTFFLRVWPTVAAAFTNLVSSSQTRWPIISDPWEWSFLISRIRLDSFCRTAKALHLFLYFWHL